MEIGTARDGTLYVWARYLEFASRIISLDLPGTNFGGKAFKDETTFFGKFAKNKQMCFIRRDSHNVGTQKGIVNLLIENSWFPIY